MSQTTTTTTTKPTPTPTTTNSSPQESSKKSNVAESSIRPSISVRLIRHAESFNNEVYRDARYIYRGGTPDFDEAGWTSYVNTHRSADPSLSQTGKIQAQKLAQFLAPHLYHQASHMVQFITSPMRRTLDTIRPTIQQLEQLRQQDSSSNNNTSAGCSSCQVLVNGFFFESEGCHTSDEPEEGMNPQQIQSLLNETDHSINTTATAIPTATPATTNDTDTATTSSSCSLPPLDVRFTGFAHADRGWYYAGTGAETRAASEARAAKFYVWLCDHLDQQFLADSDDLFDAGVAVHGEEEEDEHDKHAPRQRKRKTVVLMGHGDFMSLVLKRVVAGFGHYVETEGMPHRSAFTHFNTGITELEYFGHGRWLVMSHNQTPHFTCQEYSTLRTGGSLKDGWSYLVPNVDVVLNAEVAVAFSDEDMEEHVREQAQALKALYLSSEQSDKLSGPTDNGLSVEQTKEDRDDSKKHFIVKRGLQVVGVATYSERTGKLTDVAVRPSAGKQVSETLFAAVKRHSRGLGRSGSLRVLPRSEESKRLFQEMGFEEVEGNESEHLEMTV